MLVSILIILLVLILMLIFILNLLSCIQMFIFILNVYFPTGNDIEPYTGFEISMMAPKVNNIMTYK